MNEQFHSDTEQLIKDLEGFEDAFAKEFLERVKRRTRVDKGRMQAGFKVQVTKDAIELSNDVPYTSVYEYGDSDTRPDRMVGATVEEIDQIVKKVTKQ